MAEFLIRGSERLAALPNFKLVGRQAELKWLSSILMRSKSNSVHLVGPGGVGCSAVCLGLEALKNDANAPFDIVAKRLFWLDTDNLFASGDQAAINAAFQRIMAELYRTPNSVLIIEDARDFVEAARNNGSLHFINALVVAVDKGKTQIILESRDEDLDVVLKCHSDISERFTMMDLEEPTGDALLAIVTDAAANLARFHGIRISDDAIAAAIELTNKYRTRDSGLSRAQPERSITLLDRALSTYRLVAHEKPENIRLLEQQIAATPGGELRDTLQYNLVAATLEWSRKQDQIKKLYAAQRDGEMAIAKLHDELAAVRSAEKEREEQGGDTPVRPRDFANAARLGGLESEEVAEIRGKIAQWEALVADNKAKFDALAAEINADLRLDRRLVLAEFSRISGISVNKLNEDERAKLSKLGDGLRQRIFGQDHAVDQIADGIRVARFGRRNKDKPLAFLLLGPSGVGKTEIAKAVAALLLDDERALTRFDMSEYMEKHAVAKMIGAPPGYEGFEAGGILTNLMRKNPSRVLLFDEIEKAHPDVFNIFLQILSDGRLTDNVGRTVSFADATIIMTTNIGQTHFLGATDFEDAKAAALEELKGTYRSEFLNRFNGRQNIICFKPLDLPSIEKIVRREIGQLDASYRDQGVTTTISDRDIAAFCEAMYDPAIGARGLPGYIQANLEPIIVNTLLKDQNVAGALAVTWNVEHARFDVQMQAMEKAA